MVQESQKLSFSDVKHCGCGNCKSDNLILNSRKAQNKYNYVEIKCLDCKGSLVFGCTKEDPNTFYLRKNSDKTYDWKAYTPDSSGNQHNEWVC